MSLNTFILTDGFIFLIMGLIVLIIPSPQPGLTKKVSEEDLLPFSQTRMLLASMFIASSLLLLVIGYKINDMSILKAVSIVRMLSFILVILLNLFQLKSKRWKAAPLIVLISIFSLLSLCYLYLYFN